ncbi:MAG: mannitol dehydrogenase family protein [Cetobacterium sp.]|uniref:mannitol dehydrogenase family protein n=1 Tax=Cetobacterium sp. TaxID=2071632 RepID=UPI003F330FB0
MKLNLQDIKNIDGSVNVITPKYDVEKIKENTEKAPKWLHFGAGNIFRAYMGKVQQVLIEKGFEDTGIIVAESFDTEIIDKVYTPFDNLTILTTLDKNGEFKNEILGSIVKSIKATGENFQELKKIVDMDSLQMISFTITEKGYNLKDTAGNYFAFIEEDFKNGFENPKHVMSLVASLLYSRFEKGGQPISLVSMDNCAGNGDKIREAILTIGQKWVENGLVKKEFLDYLSDENKVAYPVTMIDKITPRPAEEIKVSLEKLGFENMDPVITSRNSFVAPFVNAEIPEYFIVEDKFPNGRPALTEAGVYITDRETVEKTEKMKVTTCLNPLHTTLAIFGCLLNKKSIYDTASDEDLNKLIKEIGYNEALKVVESPKIIDPKAFIDEVIEERFLNPYIPDQPERIATDTSQKIAIRFGETIKSYMKDENLDVKSLRYIPLVLAGWFRYLMGVDDNGMERSISNDPMLPMLKEKVAGLQFGKPESYRKGQLDDVLSNERIFGVNLVEIGLSGLVEDYLVEMLAGKDAVRNTLHKYL